MTTTTPGARAIAAEKLSRWGLLRQVRREELIDQYLENIAAPTKDKALLLQKQWCADHKLREPNSLKHWQQQHGLNPCEWAALVERPWRWSQWCLKQFESEIPAYYLKRKPLLDTVSYSLLRVRQKTLATELYLRIKEGESTFEDIASNYSEGPEQNTGGRIGPVPMQRPHPILARLLQVSSPGQLWQPKQLERWWIVVRLEKLENTSLNDEIAQRLGLELGEKYIEQILDLS